MADLRSADAAVSSCSSPNCRTQPIDTWVSNQWLIDRNQPWREANLEVVGRLLAECQRCFSPCIRLGAIGDCDQRKGCKETDATYSFQRRRRRKPPPRKPVTRRDSTLAGAGHSTWTSLLQGHHLLAPWDRLNSGTTSQQRRHRTHHNHGGGGGGEPCSVGGDCMYVCIYIRRQIEPISASSRTELFTQHLACSINGSGPNSVWAWLG